MAKRLLDLVISTVGLLLVSPLLLVLAVLVKLDSRGPVFFRQVRVGRYGVPFKVLKFRTMSDDHANIGPKVTAANDQRVTKVGGFFRKYKLDELPQLINVITGEMSLVGPRPEVPEYVEFYSADSKATVLSVRPGITDNASIIFKDEGAILADASDSVEFYRSKILPRKIELYENYVREQSVIGDIGIILRTIRAIFLKK